MIIRASVLAVLTMTSHLALAESAAEIHAKFGSSDVAAQIAAESERSISPAAATDSQIKSLERDLRPSLQSKLDALMDFEMESRESAREAIASVD